MCMLVSVVVVVMLLLVVCTLVVVVVMVVASMVMVVLASFGPESSTLSKALVKESRLLGRGLGEPQKRSWLHLDLKRPPVVKL